MKTKWFRRDKNRVEKDKAVADKDAIEYKIGNKQSPINIETDYGDVLFEEKVLGTFYGKETFNIEYLENTMVFYPKGNKNIVVYNKDVYWLTAIHGFTPSEHTINNGYYPMELQLIHENIDGRLLMVSIFFAIGDENKGIGNSFKSKEPTCVFNPRELLPKEKMCFVYKGSLTVAPYTENVDWIVFESPSFISEEQYDSYYSQYPDKNRMLQKINGRRVFKGEA